MYVYEEIFEDRKLSEIINQEHENKKYLPGIKLPDNVVSNTVDLPGIKLPDNVVSNTCRFTWHKAT